MQQSTLVVITGHPGSGKSSIGKQLADQSNVPFISKDTLKEYMFDALGTKDKTWSLQVSAAAHRIMDYMIGEELRTGNSVIVESNFKVNIDSERFNRIAKQYDAKLIQIMCEADGKVLFDRWTARITSGQRHQGHVEAIGLEQIKQDLAQPYPPLQLDGELIRLNTTDFSKLQLPRLDI